MYFHNGMFVVGRVTTHNVLCRKLSVLARHTAVLVYWGLVSKNRVPTAVRVVQDTLQQLVADEKNHNIDASRLVAGAGAGDTIGRTLAATYAALATGAGLQLQFYRGCAAYQDTASHRNFSHDLQLECA